MKKFVYHIYDNQDDEYLDLVDSPETARKAIWEHMKREYNEFELSEFAEQEGLRSISELESAIKSSSQLCEDFDYLIEPIEIKTESDF